MEKDNILLVASSTSDPARLEVHLNDHTQTLDGFSLSILEINFPGEVIFFSPGVDYIEIQKTRTNKNRKKRSLQVENKSYQINSSQKYNLLDISPIQISNFFPWVYKYQKTRLLNHKDIIKVLFHPRFSIKYLSELLGITRSEAVMKHLGVISFCMNLIYIKQGKRSSIWPKQIKSETLEMIGFKPREKSNKKTAQTFFEEKWIEKFGNEINKNVWVNWFIIFENLFNNKVEQNSRNIGISTWDIIAKLNNIISKYYEFLGYESNVDKKPVDNIKPRNQTTFWRNIQEIEVWQGARRKPRSLQPASDAAKQGEGNTIIISETTTKQNPEEMASLNLSNGKSQSDIPDPTSHTQVEMTAQQKHSLASTSLHFGSGTRKFFSVDAITDFLNNNPEFLSTAIFNETSQKLKILVSEKEKIILHGKMSDILSLPEIMSGANTYVSSHSVDPLINNRLHYIYCDISEQIVLGENYFPVVQIFSPGYKGKNHISFPTPIFVPITQKNPKKINLVIYNEVGQKVRFLSPQPSTAKILLSKKWK